MSPSSDHSQATRIPANPKKTDLLNCVSHLGVVYIAEKLWVAVKVLATPEMAENGTNLIVGLRFRGLRGPVDQPGTQRVQGLAEDRPLGRSSSTLNAGRH